jgi:hypothetical protein
MTKETSMADEKIGWEIDGRFYPHNGVDGLRHGDFALIREVTGLSIDEFDRGDDDLATETGWLAVAIWQSNPEWRRDQVVRAVEQLPADGAKRIGWAAPPKADADPPTGENDPTSESSSTRSSDAPAATTTSAEEESSEDSSPASSTREDSGAPVSRIGVRA